MSGDDFKSTMISSSGGSPSLVVVPGGDSRRAMFVTIARNSVFLLALQVVLRILGFVFNVFVVRRLGEIYFGQYSAIMAYIAIFGVFSDLGITAYATRSMSIDRSKTRELLADVIGLRLVLSVAIVGLTTGSAYLLGREPGMVFAIFLASCSQFLYSFQGPFVAALMAKERFDYLSVFSLLNSLVFWITGTLALLIGGGVVGLIVALLCGVTVELSLSGWVVIQGLGERRPRVSVSRWRRLIASGLPFGATAISYAFIDRFDTVFMSFALTDAEVGWYNVPFGLMVMLLMVAQSVARALYPTMVRAHAEDAESLKQVVGVTLKLFLIISLALTFGGAVLAEPLIVALYTPRFMNSILVMRVMIWGLPAMFLLELLGRVATTLYKEKAAARANVLNAVISVVLVVVLVHYYQILGGAIALVLGRWIRVIQLIIVIGPALLFKNQIREIVRVVGSAALMGGGVAVAYRYATTLLIDEKLILIAAILSGAALYALFLVLFGGITGREIRFLRSIAGERLRGLKR